MIRIPGWAQNKAMPSDLYSFSSSSEKKPIITVNGKPVDYQIEKGYAVIKKNWKKNDEVVVGFYRLTKPKKFDVVCR